MAILDSWTQPLTRRQWLHLTGLFATSAGLAGALSGCQTGWIDRALSTQEPRLKIGYLPITDSSPLLAAQEKGFYAHEDLDVAPIQRYRSWDAIAQAFMRREVNLIHILMPTAIWMRYGLKFPAKVMAWNHTNGSAITVLPEINRVQDLAGRAIAIPSWYSLHNVILQILLRDHGLQPVRGTELHQLGDQEVALQVLPPPDMTAALKARKIAGYIVAEPYNAAAELTQTGKLLRLTGDVWKDHGCCVVLMHEADVRQYPQWTQRVVNAIVQAQQWAQLHRSELAYLLSRDGGNYMPYSVSILDRVLTYSDSEFYRIQGVIEHPEWRSQRIAFQPYPFPSYTTALVRSLQSTLIAGEIEFLRNLDPQAVAQDLVDERFVRQAIEQVGGPQSFGLALDLNRQELIQV
ncbi:ABC transporter substrate-binding protein [Limnothrix redekei]|uniref:ABC transporter substrate-binding protein n=1 Tax=Limnothrix redekei LRLZ20PSL1 TaxID=3112953 RepID=A0ABW7C4W4_9CYAN